MVREDKSTWKANYFIKIEKLFDTYSRCFIVNADNVGSGLCRCSRSVRPCVAGPRS